MKYGLVKWFSAALGYGFILDAEGTEYFVHFRSIEGEGFKTLAPLESVSFSVEHTLKGPSAVNVLRENVIQ